MGVQESIAVKNYIMSLAAIGLLAIVWWGFKFVGVKIINTLEGLVKFSEKAEVKIENLDKGVAHSRTDIGDLYRKQYEQLTMMQEFDKNLEKQKNLTDKYNEKVLEFELDVKEFKKEQREKLKELTDKTDSIKSEHDKCNNRNKS